jgi:hypothetical protein
MNQTICNHPAYGEGFLIGFDPATGIGHFVFRDPPGMKAGRGAVYPTAEMVLVNGQWTVDDGRSVSVAEM